MADKTGIEWTEATWNPVTGCTKVSAGCKHCYAERDWARLQHLPAYAGRAFTDVATHADRLDQPLRWQRPRRIFVNSMSDLFHADIHDDFIGMVFRTMARAPQHTFQVLTKRPERMQFLMTHPRMRGFVDDVAPWPLPNVWLGVSVEDQEAADERIPLLLQTPAAVRWVSAEPLLGPVDLSSHLMCLCGMCGGDAPLRWVVVGGESGPKARPMHPQWARDLRDQCAAASVPFLFKQWGEWAPRSECYHTLTCGQAAADFDPGATKWPCIRLTAAGRNGRDLANACDGDDCYMQKVGKKLSGRALDGALHDGYPIRGKQP